jgi:hypothetical protein
MRLKDPPTSPSGCHIPEDLRVKAPGDARAAIAAAGSDNLVHVVQHPKETGKAFLKAAAAEKPTPIWGGSTTIIGHKAKCRFYIWVRCKEFDHDMLARHSPLVAKLPQHLKILPRHIAVRCFRPFW